MKFKMIKYLSLIPLALAGMLTPQSASAAVDCDTLPQFATVVMPDDTEVDINQRHIFCGEVRDFRAVGFHAQPNGETPNTVDFDNLTWDITYRIRVANQWVANGIYEMRDFLIAEDGDTNVAYAKYRSTMFPDHCSKEDVLNAIAYAAVTPQGLSGQTCLTSQGLQFPVVVFWDQNGDYVDTAYPYVP
ncbi:EndoU domain-containing protein [Aestuariispira insulae]|uniref:EndoU nuclease-like protein n=1 Tax=Aestuariispira insulae TaxID=1461337 RepID=A0A3D9HS85_9PROT|nr:EndoU domain-containing protein [Aestuariispira insulae]RED52368.1 EndoU nuclease-like protein [Aestuariispira insulae]